jgi:hypothetical protein
MLDQGSSEHHKNVTVSYPDFAHTTFNEGPLNDTMSQQAVKLATSQIDLLFSAALFARGLRADQDVWNNPLVPTQFIDNLGLAKIGQYHSRLPFVSYAGLPMFDLQDFSDSSKSDIITTMSVPFSYYYFQCESSVETTIDDIEATSASYQPNDLDNSTHGFVSDQDKTTWMAAIPPRSFMPDLDRRNNNTTIPPHGSNIDPGMLYLAINSSTSASQIGDDVAFWNCSYYNQYVNVTVACDGFSWNCTALSADPVKNGSNTYLNNGFVNGFLTSLGQSAQGAGSTFYPLLTRLLLSPTFLGAGEDFTSPSDSINSYGQAMASTLGSILNTYYQLTLTSTAIYNYTAVDKIYNLNTTIADEADIVLVYKVRWEWFTVLVCTCILLLVFGVTGIILDSKTMGPDILGFASSMTRDNRYIKLEHDDIELGEGAAQSASSKNAYETLRDLRHHKVILQDVRGHEEVGKIVLSSVGLPNGKPLSRDRLYR